MQSIREFLSVYLGLELWMAMLLAVVLVALIANQLAHLVFNLLAKWASRSETLWDESAVDAARRPVHLLIWVMATAKISRVLLEQWLEVDIDEELVMARNVAVVIVVAWFCWRFVQRITRSTIARGEREGQDFDLTTLLAISKLGRLLIFVVTAITVAQTLGFNIGALLALGGVGGLAVGLAAKDLLANFFGGLTIYLDRPFSVGEWIRSPDKSIEGTVEHISWRHTRVRAFNKNPIYVPNAVFTHIVVENPSRMSHRRIKETLGLRYDDFAQVEAVVRDIKHLLQNHPDIDATQTLIVNFNQFGASSLDIMIYTFTKTKNWVEYHAVKQAVLLEIGQIVARHGAEIAFPTQTLHVATPLQGEQPPA